MIIDLQRRMTQVGRIRLGERPSPGAHPIRLEHWKLTSRDQTRLEAAAAVFGGKVEPWEGHEGEFALHTETDNLPILLLPNQTISQAYELWSGGGCKRRCNGETEQLTDGPCLCDPENRECKPHTRLSVMLPDVAGIGVWRLDSTGWYAAVELAGTVDLLEMATTRGVLLPARLRIDQRSVLRDGKTKRFPVPTLDIDVRPLDMHAITQVAHEGEVAVLPTGYKPVAALPSGGVSVADGLAGADAQAQPPERQSARAAAPLGAVGDFESGEPIVIPDENAALGEPANESDAWIASGEQQKLLMATAREHGWKDADRYELTARICGPEVRSVKKVPKAKVDELLEALKMGPGILTAITVSADIPSEPTNPMFTPADLLNAELIAQLKSCADELGIRQQVDAAISQHTGDIEWLQRQLARLQERVAEQKAEATA